MFSLCKQGNLQRLKNILTPSNINGKNIQKKNLLYIACEYNQVEIVKYLLFDNPYFTGIL